MNPMNPETKQPTSLMHPLFIGYQGTVQQVFPTGECLLGEGFRAKATFGLLVKPLVGDQVLFVEGEPHCMIVQIISRSDGSTPVTLGIDRPLEFAAPSIRFSAFHDLDFVSLERMSLVSKHFVLTATHSLLLQAETLMQKLGQAFRTVRGVSQDSAQQQIIIATEDVRIDGKRINMG